MMGLSPYDHREKTPAVCRTPGTIYETDFGQYGVRLRILFPLPLLEKRPNEQALVDEFHAALLPVVEKLFRERWALVAGRDLDGSIMPDTWEELDPLALRSETHGLVPADVRELVISARLVAFDGAPSADALKRLDRASEAFASRIPWEDEPGRTPSGDTGGSDA